MNMELLAGREPPETLDEAIALLLEALDDAEKEELRTAEFADLTLFHFGLGLTVRNRFGLHRGNQALMRSCGSTHPDGASAMIIEALWRRLRCH